MDTKALSFNAYDFLGYLFPGAIGLVAADLTIAYHGSSVTLSYPQIIARYSSKDFGIVLPFLIAAYIVGHLLSFCSSLTVERYSVWLHNHPSKYLVGLKPKGFFKTEGASPKVSFILRCLVALFMAPIAVLDFIFGRMCGLHANYIHSLDKLVATVVRNKINILISRAAPEGVNVKSLGDPNNHDFFQVLLHYVIENAPQHLFTLRNYVVLYGFLRTVCFLLICVSWAISIHLWYGPTNWPTATAVMLGCAGISSCFFLAYQKFFQRYCEETYFALVACSLTEAAK